MLSVLQRAWRNPIDYSGFFKTRTLTLTQTIHEGSNVYSFIFKPDKPSSWKPGQHAVFTMPGREIEGKTWRAFSVASAPYEGVIRIGTTIPDKPSDFKQKLRNLTPGETIKMHGPFGELHRSKRTKHIVGIAGGIGITPFRSMIADLVHSPTDNTKITLLYSCTEFYAYKDELDAWATDPRVEIKYMHTPDEVNAAIAEQTKLHRNEAYYFISGSPGMIEAIIKTLRQKGVRNIVNDPFKGY